ncbi:hypothetical protein HU200_022675 [Digitaria exilis]|uniref:Uncharacterized protein n=1 Tax=Digitaria exilis TaxID=1010633 RepID=A0A835C736_9POAL|nr:hypothetical protein HU200_022675 [Digitaria exilis]
MGGTAADEGERGRTTTTSGAGNCALMALMDADDQVHPRCGLAERAAAIAGIGWERQPKSLRSPAKSWRLNNLKNATSLLTPNAPRLTTRVNQTVGNRSGLTGAGSKNKTLLTTTPFLPGTEYSSTPRMASWWATHRCRAQAPASAMRGTCAQDADLF